MVNLKVVIRSGDLKPLYQSIFLALSENLDSIYWVDFYNINSLIDKMKRKKSEDFYLIPKDKKITLKFDINECESYRTLCLKKSIIWEDVFFTLINRDVIQQLDQQTHELKRIIVEN